MKKYRNKCLITGGTGTFGTAYIMEAIKNHWHSKIVVYSRDEFKQIKTFEFLVNHFKCKDGTHGGETPVALELHPYSVNINGTQLRFLIGDVCDYPRLERAIDGMDLVIHAAALKHVNVCEYNTMVATAINIDGTRNVVNACGRCRVGRLIALSTDKAVDPANLYGATKLCLEKIVLGGNHIYPDSCMSVVRYGNIIGSKGSIIHKLLTSEVEDISITDPTMTRFWFPIEGAVELVRDCLTLERNTIGSFPAAIYVPKLKALSVEKLFKYMIPEADLKVTGTRPGEKMHECMISNTDINITLEHVTRDYYIINPSKGTEYSISDPKYQKTEIKDYTSNNVPTYNETDFMKMVESSIITTIIKSM